MPNFQLTIEYDGTNFCGWQIQRKGERTVQAEIKRAIERIVKHPVTLVGAGRTDSGVHARGQAANFHTTSAIKSNVLLKALNANLPEDVAILQVKKVPDSFHAQFSAKSKIYRYTILNREARSVKDRGFYHQIRQPIDIKKLKKVSRTLVGRHDFRAFMGTSCSTKNRIVKENTVRTIKKITFSRRDDCILCDIEADGFLYKMVRNIVGTLIDIALDRIPAQNLKRILASRDRRQAGVTAPAHGLELLKVKY